MTTATNATFVQLDQLGVRYANGVVGLTPTTLSFRRDQLTVLLGPSGAGKSTLLRVINHLVTPTTGEVRISGLASLQQPLALRQHRRQTAMIFQQHQLIGRRSALQNVLLSRLGHYPSWRTLLPLPQTDQRLALACLARVGLLDQALQRCDTLSGGQQQRVGIARALCQQPRLILADEPVASLDPASAERVLGQLRAVCREDGIPAIVSLHQLDYARTFADRVIGLSAGQVVFDGPPNALGDRHLNQIYGRDRSTEASAGSEITTATVAQFN